MAQDNQWDMLQQGATEDSVGHLFPFIRVKDHVIQRKEIIRFELDMEDFLPTIKFKIGTVNHTLARENAPVDGDRVNIFIRQDMKVFRPISGDYVIDSVEYSNDNNAAGNDFFYITIEAHLFVPLLNSNTIHFNYSGKAGDALKEVAARIGLGYVHTGSNQVEGKPANNPETKYDQNWICWEDPETFIHYVTKHMWLAKDSFFDSWIDPYRNLTCINVNDILGRKVIDDGRMDLTKFKSIIGTNNEDGKYISNDFDKASKSPWPKLFTNNSEFAKSLYFVHNYDFENNSSQISQIIGTQINVGTYVQNQGMGQAVQDSNLNVDVGVWYNKEKLDLGYVIANGPTNYSEQYKAANNGSWKTMNTKSFTPEIVPIEADSDQITKEANQNNTKTSGNVFKMYKIAEYHNYINNMELEKQILTLHCAGCNLGIAKGEKVPVILENVKNDRLLSPSMRFNDYSAALDRKNCGWFIVKGLRWIYEPTGSKMPMTDWRTDVILTRREWMSPEPTATAKEAEDTLEIDAAKGQSSVESQISTGNSKSKSNNVSTVNNEPVKDSITTDLELSGMVEECKGNYEYAMQSIDTVKSLNAAATVEDAISNVTNGVNSAKDIINNSVDKLSNISDISNTITNATDKLKTIAGPASELRNKIGNIITNGAEGLNKTSLDDIKGKLNTYIDSGTNIASNLTDSIDKLGSSLDFSNAKSALSLAKNLFNEAKDLTNDINNVIVEESSIKKNEIKNFDESNPQADMEYDPNGLKHFMNIWLGVMSTEGMPFAILATRRWAVTKEDKTVYGNAFTEQQSTETYKTLDSDNNLYWYSDFNSRHYYGEAVDIKPTSSMSDLLEKMCLNDNVCNIMHKYGICMQVETSQVGPAKGTHFHVSTERNSPQTNWWSIVNRMRIENKLETYVVIAESEYYEEETKNSVIIV